MTFYQDYAKSLSDIKPEYQDMFQVYSYIGQYQDFAISNSDVIKEYEDSSFLYSNIMEEGFGNYVNLSSLGYGGSSPSGGIQFVAPITYPTLKVDNGSKDISNYIKSY